MGIDISKVTIDPYESDENLRPPETTDSLTSTYNDRDYPKGSEPSSTRKSVLTPIKVSIPKRYRSFIFGSTGAIIIGVVFITFIFAAILILNSMPGGVAPDPTRSKPTSTRNPTATSLDSQSTIESTLSPTHIIPQIVTIVASVDTRSLRVRSGPGINYGTVGGLQREDLIVLDGRNQDGSWGRISGLNQWISIEFLKTDGNIYELNVVTPSKDP